MAVREPNVLVEFRSDSNDGFQKILCPNKVEEQQQWMDVLVELMSNNECCQIWCPSGSLGATMKDVRSDVLVGVEE
jgi:hypothetical protein